MQSVTSQLSHHKHNRELNVQDVCAANDDICFLPGILQREFIVVAKGDTLTGRKISHIATQGIVSCLALVFHKSGDTPITSLSHIDLHTDLNTTLENIFKEFGTKPDHAEIMSQCLETKFTDDLIENGLDSEDAYELVQDIRNDRNKLVSDLQNLLNQNNIPLTNIDLDQQYSTFIADISSGKMWSCAEKPGMVWHNRDCNTLLRNFYAHNQDQTYTPAMNPYNGQIQHQCSLI